MIETIKKQSVSDLVYNKMLDMIIEGHWKQGTMIPSENELCDSFSVSRNTIRQAIHRLSALGILDSHQGKGTFVRNMDAGFYLNLLSQAVFLGDKDSLSILEFMKSIQVESTRIVCKTASDDEIVALADFIHKMKTTTNYEDFFESDIGYHVYLSELTGNNLFVKSMEIASVLLHVYLRDIVAFHGSDMSIDQHVKCYEALLSRDVDKAVKVMEEHYDMLLQRMRSWLKNKQCV